jgi:hypothetical protein
MKTIQTPSADTTNSVVPNELARIELNAHRKQLRRIRSLKVDFFNTLSRLGDCAEFTRNLQANAHKTLAEIALLSNEHCRWCDPSFNLESDLAIALAALIDGTSA